ncbi:unnamed protein product [Toxocara canis]|uniref:CID domain-containing protein n=1 Tax=Toxocara canis TaxID=6265 RepID=A0A183URX0_TOXCA|nr:unnamed protein product [Toxocara canis]
MALAELTGQYELRISSTRTTVSQVSGRRVDNAVFVKHDSPPQHILDCAAQQLIPRHTSSKIVALLLDEVTSLFSSTPTAASRHHPTTTLSALSIAFAHLCADVGAPCKTAATRVVTGWHEVMRARSLSQNARRTESPTGRPTAAQRH